MASGRNLTVYLTSDVSKFAKGLRQGESSLKRFGKAAAVGLGAAAAAATAFTIEAVKAAAEDEAAQKQLARAMENTLGATQAQIDAMEEYVSTAQRKTGMDDGDLRNGLKMLLRATKDTTRAQALSNVAQKISLETGADYTRVIKALIKAEEGNFAQIKKITGGIGEQAGNYADLQKATLDYQKAQENAGRVLETYGPKSKEYAAALGKVKDKAQALARVKGGGTKWLAELNAQFRGSIADDAKTYAGGLRRVSTAWGELEEAFGAGVMGGSDAPQVMQDFADAMYEAGPAAEQAGQMINAMMTNVLRQLPDFIAGLQSIPTFWDTFVQTVSGGVTSAGDFLGVIPDNVAQSMQDQYARKIAQNNQALAGISAGVRPQSNFYTGSRLDSYSSSSAYSQTRYRTRVNDAAGRGDARAAQRDARTRSRP